MFKRRDHVGSFRARDERGNVRTLDAFVDILDAWYPGNPDEEAEGLATIMTGDGQPVLRLEKGRYRELISGGMLNSDDPDAP